MFYSRPHSRQSPSAHGIEDQHLLNPLPDSLQLPLDLDAGNGTRYNAVQQSQENALRTSFSSSEEEKLLSDAMDALDKLTQSIENYFDVLARVVILQRDIFPALSVFDSMCNRTKQFDKLWRLLELHRVAIESNQSRKSTVEHNMNSIGAT